MNGDEGRGGPDGAWGLKPPRGCLALWILPLLVRLSAAQPATSAPERKLFWSPPCRFTVRDISRTNDAQTPLVVNYQPVGSSPEPKTLQAYHCDYFVVTGRVSLEAFNRMPRWEQEHFINRYGYLAHQYFLAYQQRKQELLADTDPRNAVIFDTLERIQQYHRFRELLNEETRFIVGSFTRASFADRKAFDPYCQDFRARYDELGRSIRQEVKKLNGAGRAAIESSLAE